MTADELTRWLMDAPHDAADPGAFMRALVDAVAQAGVPIWRASYALMTKHPEVLWRTVRWKSGVVSIDDQPHARLEDPFYKDSPVRDVRDGMTSIRVPLTNLVLPYPICVDLRAEGGTDYFIQGLRFTNGEVGYVAWAANADGGFTDAHLAHLEKLRPFLALRLELESAYYATRALLPVYLGHNAARRVLAGEVQRGKGELIDAAIWFSDMRDFTALSDRTPPAQVIEKLDAYFDAVATPISANGGEVLKFIGDAVLAIFPVGKDPRDACRRALAAAEAGIAAIDKTGITIGVALHRGQVMYGNIGAKDRLDFTVISSAVNEASRLEGLCKKLATPLALSAAFVAAAGLDGMLDLGSHELKGVSAPLHVYTPSHLARS
jgi:adenylate cyclase